ncbi:MAG TPA: helicase [Accumulibacter sp.]|uniref:DEAD/DEAH box helicase n=1 Tax=Accumulibacter sp. TaxID=2053492 RepID=UPI002CDDD8BC|nr:helicase-related protein [Accumulibacter sp.]HMV06528.1 helicase [Accumulibacter sp.]HND81578.1 helicase [Accumulibacter sp.]
MSDPAYSDFLARKFQPQFTAGIEQQPTGYGLFEFQEALTAFALRRGRAALFCDTGLGKTRMQIAWADTVRSTTRRDVLILAPLAVADQTVSEGRSIFVPVNHVRTAADVRPGISICNYERLHLLDPARFGGIVLDESSIIKHHGAKTFSTLSAAFAETPFKLCATATPAPNDYAELGTHAEFLGVRSRPEMLAEFFVHDGGDTQTWRLKGHARAAFWQWVAEWGAMIRSPADLGYRMDGYTLPPLSVHQHTIETPLSTLDGMFADEAQTLMDQRQARRDTIEPRARACADLINAHPDEPAIVWCDLNAEGDLLEKTIAGAVQVSGADTIDEKEARLRAFAEGRIRVLITKPSICGYGLNWQHCRLMAFVGVTHSFEMYYQAVRRCWRYGQKRPVEVHVFSSDREGQVVRNLQRKEAQASLAWQSLAAETHAAVRRTVLGNQRQTNEYLAEEPVIVPAFLQAA